MMPKSWKCQHCGQRTSAMQNADNRYCKGGPGRQGCQSKLHQARQRVAREGLLVDVIVGGGWWIWDAKGNVLVIGQTTRDNALFCLIEGDDREDPMTEQLS